MDFSYKDTCQISEKDIYKTGETLLPYLSHIKNAASANHYDSPENSVNLPFDSDILRDILEIKKEKNAAKLKYIIVVGIGGSNLGAKAVYDAIYGHFDILEPSRFPKMIFMDTNDAGFTKRIGEFIKLKIKNPEEILVNVVSASGKTIETISNFEFIVKAIENKFKNANERFVITTDFQSDLWKEAEERNMAVLKIPQKISGRYSVFSAVGLFPIACAGIDIEKLLKGAVEMRNRCFEEDISLNPAILSTAVIFLNYKQGKIINDSFFFHPELESLGKWYRQLMAESLGKEKDINGKTVNFGITPSVSIGSTDLHSMAQLYLGGPKDKFTNFLCSGENKIMKAIYESVKKSYAKKNLPFVEIILDDISAGSLGEFMQFKMIEMMFLANLAQVNAFNQPNVEEYKIEAKKLFEN